MLRKYCYFTLLAFLLFSTTGCRRQNTKLHICFAGDLLLDRGVRKQIEQRGMSSLLTSVAPALHNADAAVVNLECPVTDIVSPVHKRFVFRGSPSCLTPIREAGITHLVMANNHSYDQGRNGLIETYTNITQHGLIPIGYGSSQQAACTPTIIEKNGIRVAVFASVLLPLECWPYLPHAAGMCQATSEELAKCIIAHKKLHTNDYIVVSLHWGTEYQETHSLQQRQQAQQLIDAGADAIIGHHPHVIQPMHTYKGKPIFYSLGNFIFDQNTPTTSKGLLVTLSFDRDSISWSSRQFHIKSCKPTL